MKYFAFVTLFLNEARFPLSPSFLSGTPWKMGTWEGRAARPGKGRKKGESRGKMRKTEDVTEAEQKREVKGPNMTLLLHNERTRCGREREKGRTGRRSVGREQMTAIIVCRRKTPRGERDRELKSVFLLLLPDSFNRGHVRQFHPCMASCQWFFMQGHARNVFSQVPH